jgi:hypothetical protein
VVAVVTTKEIGLDQGHSMGTWTPVANVEYQLRICSMCQQKTVSSSGMTFSSLNSVKTKNENWSNTLKDKQKSVHIGTYNKQAIG